MREQLANPKVQIVLLADGRVFKGAVTALPTEAAPTEPAVTYAEQAPETIPPEASADEAYARAAASPTRRVIVLDDDHNLLGSVSTRAEPASARHPAPRPASRDTR